MGLLKKGELIKNQFFQELRQEMMLQLKIKIDLTNNLWE